MLPGVQINQPGAVTDDMKETAIVNSLRPLVVILAMHGASETIEPIAMPRRQRCFRRHHGPHVQKHPSGQQRFNKESAGTAVLGFGFSKIKLPLYHSEAVTGLYV